MNRNEVIAQLPHLFPLAVAWAEAQERRILSEGTALTSQEMRYAEILGVHDAGRVRLLAVARIPRPEDVRLRDACDAINFLTAETRGLTVGHGIFVRKDCWRDAGLVAHELVHTMQYERFGGIAPFLETYLTECLTVGYDDSPLEQEARGKAARLRL